MPEKTKDLDTMENYYQNSITQAANLGAFSLAITPINELTQMNNIGIETNINLTEKREELKEVNRL